MRNVDRSIETITNIGGISYSQPIDTRHMVHIQIQGTFTKQTPVNLNVDASEVNPTPDNSFSVESEYPTATRIAQITTTGTLPGGINPATGFNLINDDLNDGIIKLASNRNNALDGTVKTITSQGTGVHTIEWQTALGGTIFMEKTLGDPTDQNALWFDVDSDEVISGFFSHGLSDGNSNYQWVLPNISFNGFRFRCNVTQGLLTARFSYSGKGA